MGIAKIPAVLWLFGVVLTFGVAVSPAQGSRTHHYDFFVSLLAFTYRAFSSVYVFQSYICMHACSNIILHAASLLLACLQYYFVKEHTICNRKKRKHMFENIIFLLEELC